VTLFTRLRRTPAGDQPADAQPAAYGESPATEVAEPVEAAAAAGTDQVTGPVEVEAEPVEPVDTVAEPVDAAAMVADGDPAGPVVRRPGRIRRFWRHPVARWITTALAAVLLFMAFAGPDNIDNRTWKVFLRLPLEGLLGYAVLIMLPPKARKPLAGLAGAFIALLAVEKVVDVGFFAVLDRPFDLVMDWGLLSSATGVLEDSAGRAATIVIVIAVIVGLAAGLLATAGAAVRLTDVGAHNDRVARPVVAALIVIWVALAVSGTEYIPGVRVADQSTAALVHARTQMIKAGLHDKADYDAAAANDPYQDTPGSQFLTGLRGKDVVFSFVESYGRSALEDPNFAGTVDPVLDAGSKGLAAAGFYSKSAFLTSSTVGGGSWLAHASLLSGVWINNQQRYRSLVSSSRLTLPKAFNEAGWRTVSIEPAVDAPFPEREFYGYQKGYDLRNMDYQGPRFSYSPIPDQYVYDHFQKTERAPGHKPLMAELTLTSSHTPWTPLPQFIDWKDVGDGTIYNNPVMRQGDSPATVWKSTARVRQMYATSVAYSLTTIISYLKTYGDKNLVFVFLGDHQPAPIITGKGASKDVPIVIVAKDKSVLDKISGWGWQDGLRPMPSAPTWRMDTFRNKFLTAFGSEPQVH
jgi:hypothetical protein